MNLVTSLLKVSLRFEHNVPNVLETFVVLKTNFGNLCFCLFVPVQVWCTLKFKTFVFFCPCAGLVHFEVQNVWFFLSLCRFDAKPNA